MSHTQHAAECRDFQRFLGMKPEEELEAREAEIRKTDPEQGDTPLYIGERLQLITSVPELLSATGFPSEKEYLAKSMERLGLSTSTAYAYRKAYRVQQKYKKQLRHYAPENDTRDGYLGKLLVLDLAVRNHCKGHDDKSAMREVMKHFIHDSYREFRFYAKPGIEREERWRKKLKVWKQQIIGELKMGYKVYFIYYQPTDTLDEWSLRNFIIDSCKEVT